MRTLVLEGDCFQSFITPLAKTYEHWNDNKKGPVSYKEYKQKLKVFENWLMNEYAIESVKIEGSLRAAVIHDECKYIEWMLRFG